MARAQMHAEHPLMVRIRGEFLEMPGLCLTAAQASRLWSLDTVTAAMALEMLVESGALARTMDGRYVASSGSASAWSPTPAFG